MVFTMQNKKMFSIQRIEVNTMGYDTTNEIRIRILYMPNWYIDIYDAKKSIISY